MDPWKKKLKLWKLYFLRILPKCFLSSLLFYAFYVIIGSLFSTKSDLLSSSVDLAPGEVVPYKNPVTESHDLYYNNVFKRLFDQSYISRRSKVLSIDSINGQDVAALKKIGVADVTGITDMPSALFIVTGQGSYPFENNAFDFEFFGYNTRFKYWTANPAHTASEIGRTLKVGGYAVIHVLFNDEYSFNSFINLFMCCTLVSAKILSGFEYAPPSIHEVIFKKTLYSETDECTVAEFRQKMVNELEPLVTFERPGDWEGPWGNDKATLRYLSSMVDLSFKEKYIYIDLGANSYNSSIGMWFDKEYPKQNKPFEIYAVEPDSAFHEEYKGKHGLTLLPFAAWLKNETLTFEVFKLPEFDGVVWENMGYVQEDKERNEKDVVKTFSVEAFDFTEWLLRTATKRDYVVVKMDVEGDEFKLLNRLAETGALCLIDELFLECHYDHPAFDAGPKHKRTLSDCLDIYTNLRKDGCIVHQWW